MLELKLIRDFPIFVSGSSLSIGSKRKNALAVRISFLLMSFELVTAFSGERVCALGDGDRYVGSIGNCADSFLKISVMIYPMTILKGTFKTKTKT